MNNSISKKILLSIFIIFFVVSIVLLFWINADADDLRKEKIYVLVNQKVVVAQYDPDENNVTVTDNNGDKVSVAYNNDEARFFPQNEGVYKIKYNDGFVTSVYVFAELPENTFILSDEFSTEYGVGKELVLPSAMITSEAASYNEYDIIIELAGQQLKTISVKEGDAIPLYKLTQKGQYTIKYSITDVFGNKDYEAYNFDCTDKAEMNFTPVPRYLEYGVKYDFGQPVAVKDGIEETATVSVFLEGEPVKLQNNAFTPEIYGDYTGSFVATINGERIQHNFSFSVIISPAGLFSSNDSILSITAGVEYPAYAYDRNHTGVEIVAAASGASVEFKNPIKLDRINNGQDIIAFQAISKSGFQDIKQIQISLTDENDPTNYIKVNITAHITNIYDAYVKAIINGIGATGIGSPDYGNEGFVYSDVYGDQSGAMMTHGSFSGSRISTNPSVNDKALDFNFRYYAKNNQIWMTARDMSRYDTADDDSIISHMVLDLDDESQVGSGKAFKGFSSDKVKIKITFTQLQGQSGIIVRSLGGYNLEGDVFDDTEAPELSFVSIDDEANFGGDEAPYAVVGKPYKLPQMLSEDFVDGKKIIEPKVYYTDSVESQLQQTSNGVFVPETAGNYELLFTALDSNNNETEKRISFVVYAESRSPVYYNEPDTSDRLLKSVFEIPDISISGVSGIPSTAKQLVYCGEDIVLDSEVPNIYLSKLGEISFIQTWTDYIGQTFKKEYTIKVVVNGQFVSVDEAPKVMEVGQTITVPDFIALDGSFNQGEAGYELDKKIVVSDSRGDNVLGNDRQYTAPDTAQDITIKYYVNDETEPSETRTVKVIDIQDGGQEIVKYFRTTGISIETTKDNVMFKALKEDNLVEMPYPVVAESMNIKLMFPSDGADYLDVRFTDTVSPDLSLFLRFYKSSSSTIEVKVNGTGVSYYANFRQNIIELIFDAKDKVLYDANGNKILNFKAYENGTQFLGFSEGIAYITFSMGGINNSAEFGLEALSNQIFNNSVTAYYRNNGGSGPAIRYEHKMQSARVGINTKILISAAKGYDVLSSFPNAVTVTVTLSTGTKNVTIYNNVSANETRELLLDEYGYYTITYKAVNKFSPQFTQYVTINVIDEVAPTMTVNGTIASEYKLNDTITLPTMTVEDNRPDYTNNVTTKYIFVVRQMRRESLQEGQTYTFDETGSYQILYIAYDASYNKTIQKFDIIVK